MDLEKFMINKLPLEIQQQNIKINSNAQNPATQQKQKTDSIFTNNTEQAKQTPDAKQKQIEDIMNQAILKNALEAEKARVNAANVPRLQQGLQQAIEQFSNKVIAALIRIKLNNEEPDLASLINLPQVQGINGGTASFGLGGITNTTIGLGGNIKDQVEVSAVGVNGQSLQGAGVAAISLSIGKSFNEAIVKKEILNYIGQKNYINSIKKMKPGDFIVFETDPNTGFPTVTAKCGAGGKVTIDVMKNGLKLSMTYKSDEIGKDPADNKSTKAPKPQAAAKTAPAK